MNTQAALRLAYNRVWRHSPLRPVRIEIVNSLEFAGAYLKDSRTIQLSKEYVQAWTPEQVEQTVLHELAHHLSKRPGHGREWLEAARRIGYTGGERIPESNPKPDIVWHGICHETGQIVEIPRDPRAAADDEAPCIICSSQSHGMTWERRQNVSAALHSIPPEPNEFASVPAYVRAQLALLRR